KVQFFLVGELLLQFERVDADADDNGIELSKLLNAVAETAGLDGSATGQGFGEEIKNDVFAFYILQAKSLGVLFVGQDRPDVGSRQLDVGSGFALLDLLGVVGGSRCWRGRQGQQPDERDDSEETHRSISLYKVVKTTGVRGYCVAPLLP